MVTKKDLENKIKVLRPVSQFKFGTDNPDYTEINGETIERALNWGATFDVPTANVAAGPGTVEHILFQLAQTKTRMGKPENLGPIDSIDYNPKRTQEAKDNLKDLKINVDYITGRAQDLTSLIEGKRENVLILNAIHQILEKQEVIDGVSKIQDAGGILIMNTSYYKPSDEMHIYGSSTREKRFWRRISSGAIRIIKDVYGDQFLDDIQNIERNIGSAETLKPEQYLNLMEHAGYEAHAYETTHHLGKDIYRDFVELDDEVAAEILNLNTKHENYKRNLDIGRAALMLEFDSAFEKEAINDKREYIATLERGWLHLIGIKKQNDINQDKKDGWDVSKRNLGALTINA